MALIKEVDKALPDYYKMSNNKIIITAHVGEETGYFYDELGPHTTIIVLTKPECYLHKKIFLDLMNDLGTTAIMLDEDEDFNERYMLGQRAQKIIGSLLKNYDYKHIIIPPKYEIQQDPQNREIYNFVTKIVRETNKINGKFKNKLYTYNKIGGKKEICDIQKGIIELYCRIAEENNELNADSYRNFMGIATKIKGIKQLEVD